MKNKGHQGRGMRSGRGRKEVKIKARKREKGQEGSRNVGLEGEKF